MSRTFFYFGGIKKSIIKFLSIFDGIQIAKMDKNGNVLKYVDIPVKFMPKQKWYMWMNKRSHEKRYPMIGVELTSIKYDNNRRRGNEEKIKVSSTDNEINFTDIPIPYNLGFTLSIATEYQHEMDQINEQLLPFFAPDVYTTVDIDDLDITWNMQVLFEGASIETESTIDESDNRNIIWTHTYSAKTWLLKPTTSINKVKKIVNKFYLSDNSWDKRSETEMPSGGGFEDEELLVLGDKKDDEILAEYYVFN